MNKQNEATQPFLIKYEESTKPYELSKHFHRTYEIVFVTNGQSIFEISDKVYYAERNAMLFINNLEFHRTSVSKYPYKRYFMLISQEYLHSIITDPILLSILKQRPKTFNHMLELDQLHSQQMLDLFRIIRKEYSDDSVMSLDAIGNYLNLILIKLFRHYPDRFPSKESSSSIGMINAVQNHIEKNYAQTVSLAETAEMFNIDMYYLSHLFRDVTGFSFKEYLILQRLTKAKELLALTNQSVTDICNQSGFNNVNHFIRTFKAKEKLTPLQFRKVNQF